jgi:hypothetical protein
MQGKNRWLIFLSFIALLGCKKNRVIYEISDKYSGPCDVFIYKTDLREKSNKVFVENGLGRVSEKMVTQEFNFFSKETHIPLDIIDIGKVEEATKNKKYIFELVYGYSSSKCTKEDLHLVFFFYGYKSEYLKWSKVYHDEFEYFDSKGIDWCKYYKSGIK